MGDCDRKELLWLQCSMRCSKNRPGIQICFRRNCCNTSGILALDFDQTKPTKKLVGFCEQIFEVLKEENKMMLFKLKKTLNGILWASDVQFNYTTTAFA